MAQAQVELSVWTRPNSGNGHTVTCTNQNARQVMGRSTASGAIHDQGKLASDFADAACCKSRFHGPSGGAETRFMATRTGVFRANPTTIDREVRLPRQGAVRDQENPDVLIGSHLQDVG